MRRLAGAREDLDGELSDARVLAGNLRDLGRVNRFLGGAALSRHAVYALARDAALPTDASASLLDVGTGAADIPLALIEDWRRRGRDLRVLGIDSRPEVLASARERPEVVAAAGLSLRVADGLALPFEAGAFDLAHASLVLHHLEPGEAAILIREMARVARHGIVMNDLARGWLPWLAAWILFRVATRNSFTRHDGPLSVRRAYSVAEARDLLTGAGLRIVHEESAVMGHRWVLAARRA